MSVIGTKRTFGQCSQDLAHKYPRRSAYRSGRSRMSRRQAAAKPSSSRAAVAESLIAALEFRGRMTVSIHNRVIASRTAKNL
jgi:hypothetical protein